MPKLYMTTTRKLRVPSAATAVFINNRCQEYSRIRLEKIIPEYSPTRMEQNHFLSYVHFNYNFSLLIVSVFPM